MTAAPSARIEENTRKLRDLAAGRVSSKVGGPGLSPKRDLIRMTQMGTARAKVRTGESSAIGTLEGYAAVFGSETTIDSWEGKFRERIAPGAFARTLAARRDQVRVLFDHGLDPSIGGKPLGQPTTLREDKVGLWLECPLDDTSYNRDLAESLRSGALSGMSFRFTVNQEQWDQSGSGLPLRTLEDVDLFELGPVGFPAYEATTAGIRTLSTYRSFLEKRVGDHPPRAGRAAYGTSARRPVTHPTRKQRATMHAQLRRLAML